LGQHGDAPLIGAVGDPDVEGPDQPDGAHQHQEGDNLLNSTLDHSTDCLLQPRGDDRPSALFDEGPDFFSGPVVGFLQQVLIRHRSARAVIGINKA
jgi:hypothetical protein